MTYHYSFDFHFTRLRFSALFHALQHNLRLFNPYPANVDKMVAPAIASKWRMGFNSAFKGLIKLNYRFPCPLFKGNLFARDLS
jgi:hypothetical protein